MFDFAWSEIGLIGVVALIAIGPKDMPVAVKTVTDLIKKVRRMAGEFQGHVDELVREANLHEVRDQLNEIRGFDIRGAVERAVDGDGSLRRAFDDPFATPAPAAAGDAALAEPIGDVAVAERPETAIAAPGEAAQADPVLLSEADAADIPAFVPPGIVSAARATRLAPAFIPPEVARREAGQAGQYRPYA